MFGCGSCGAQARRDDLVCPVCGAPLARSTATGAHIPVRRYGEVPPYPIEYEELLEEDGPRLRRRARPRLPPYALAAVSALMLAACAGYWLR